MEFRNRSEHQADAFWGVSGKDEMGAVVIAKATYEIGPNGELQQTQEEPWPVHFDNLETPYGLFVSEHTPYCKPKVDLMVCGRARTRGGRPQQQMDLRVTAGPRYSCLFRVFGDRFWERRGRRLVPTTPAPFTEMPLTVDRAFGGAVETEWGELPCQTNRQGRGFYLEPSQAEGGPLPNLEDPLALIEGWDDRPAPLAPGPFPPESGLRAELIPEDRRDPEHFIEWDHLFLCNAHPRMMLDEAPAPGEEVCVDGVRHEGPLRARVPACGVEAHVRCGRRKVPIPLRLDTIIVQGEERRAVFRWRGGTRFQIRPREKRTVVLESAQSGAGRRV